MSMSKDFIDGYCDGQGQAIENVRWNLLEFFKKHNNLTQEDINQICDYCLTVDMDYLNQ